MKTIKTLCCVLILISACKGQSTVVDLRNDITKPKNWIGLAVTTNSPTGHAFVILGKENPEKAVTELAVKGFYRDPDGIIRGKVENDFLETLNVKNADQIFFLVEDKDYENAIQVAKKWIESPGIYHIFGNNCIDFTQKVLDAAGVDLPSANLMSLTPKTYLDRIQSKLSDQGLDNNNGSKILLYEKGTYIGPLKNGFPNGKGRLVTTNSVYNGEFKNGARTVGTLTAKNETYSGEFKNGVYHGNGKRVTENYTYTGEFKNGKPNGQGVLQNRKDNYELNGMFVNGRIEGRVKKISDGGNKNSSYTIKNGDYISPIETKYRDGSTETIITDSKGTKSSSEYKGVDGTNVTLKYSNEKPSQAHYKLSNGKDILIDKFYDGNSDSGHGTVTTKDYSYVGDLKLLQFHGKGVLIIGQDKWEGDFINGRAEGTVRVTKGDLVFDGQIWYDQKHSYQKGTVRFANGDTYQGELRNFVIHGNGIFSHTEPPPRKILFFRIGNSNSYTVTYNNFDSEKVASVMAPPRPISPAEAFPDVGLFKGPPPLQIQESPKSNGIDANFNTNTLDYNNLDMVPSTSPSNPIPKKKSPQFFKDPITGKQRLL